MIIVMQGWRCRQRVRAESLVEKFRKAGKGWIRDHIVKDLAYLHGNFGIYPLFFGRSKWPMLCFLILEVAKGISVRRMLWINLKEKLKEERKKGRREERKKPVPPFNYFARTGIPPFIVLYFMVLHK